MLKLTMCPRKRSKRYRAIPHRLRMPSTSRLETEEPEMDQWRALSDNLRAMLKQEASGKYSCSDYLCSTAWQEIQLIKKPKYNSSQQSPRNAVMSVANARIDEYCREQIVEWSFRVVDYFHIDREVVAVSLSFLDRFLGKCLCDRSTFKLAATTALNLAVKILYPCKLADLGILSDLSRGEFDMKDVAEMEARMLDSLSWNLHPPTAMAFAVIFLDYFFASRVVTISRAHMEDIYDVASFFTELAVCDYSFISLRSSTVALASVLNALEGMFGQDNYLDKDILQTAQKLSFGICPDLKTARNCLWDLYERSEECALNNERGIEDDVASSWHGGIFVKKASTLSSPVSVSKPCHSASDFPCSPHDEVSLRNESW